VKLITSGAALALIVAGAVAATPALAQRANVHAVGSSTVYPFATVVAEQFQLSTGQPSPVIEQQGTGGGIALFCAGVGPATPDISNASSAMSRAQYDGCVANGVTSITEALFGYDALSIAQSIDGPTTDLTKAQLYQALAAQVLVGGVLVPNPYTNWSQIDPALPNEPILVYGPPSTSGTRVAWHELVMRPGCATVATAQAVATRPSNAECETLRTDGYYVEAGENDNLIVQRLVQDPNALGIFGYSFLFENSDRLKGATVAGVAPSPAAVADGTYTVSRPLFIYIKNAHRGVIPGLEDFVTMFVSDAAIGPDGYLIEHGLVPLADDLREATRAAVAAGTQMTRYAQ
jgi:phosphate transport system substrate-binding protein